MKSFQQKPMWLRIWIQNINNEERNRGLVRFLVSSIFWLGDFQILIFSERFRVSPWRYRTYATASRYVGRNRLVQVHFECCLLQWGVSQLPEQSQYFFRSIVVTLFLNCSTNQCADKHSRKNLSIVSCILCSFVRLRKSTIFSFLPILNRT